MADKGSPSPCGVTDHDPKRPDNRPGLDQIAYRITRHGQSFDRMTWNIPRQKGPGAPASYPLTALRTRDLDDPTISLIDAWAMAADVLSFYSERVANEGYIATATQRRSVLELARMIGYELSPGVAASTHLAFHVEDADDPYRTVAVAPGVQAMSIPAKKDELPQIFETLEEITARAEWNAIHARTERPQNLVLYTNPDDPEDARNGTLYLFDLDGSFGPNTLVDPDLLTLEEGADLTGYHPLSRRIDLAGALADRIADSQTNDQISPAIYALPVDEICLTGLGLNLKPGTRVLAVGQGTGEVTALPLRVVSAEEDRPFGLTRVVLTKNGKPPEKVRKSPFFTFAFLLPGIMPDKKVPLDTAQLQTTVRGKSWTGDGLSALVQSQNWQRTKVMTLLAVLLFPKQPKDDTDLGFFAMRDSAGFFGNTAPLWDTLDYGEGSKGPYKNKNWDNVLGTNTIWMDGLQNLYSGEAQAYLEREIKEIQPGGWAILESPKGDTLGLRVTHAAAESRADYAITGKAMGLGFETAAGKELELGDSSDATIYNNFRFRGAQLFAVSQHLPQSGVPLSKELEQASTSVELDGLYLDLERGRPVSIFGARLDAEGINGRETQIIREIQHVDGVTRLLFEGETAYRYDRTTVRINANVAAASHGERVQEDLGSGDARLSFQTFTLSKPPLTYVSAVNASGRASTLEIRVDGILWSEIPALGQAGPEDAVYELRQSNDGKSHVRFGDGRTGRRLPTGELNVTASYRSGLGISGEVGAEAISQLKTRPLGIKSVVNPSPATGSGDPETLENARVNAPAAVKTLGRIVSLTDYQDFALNFAGIGKAQVRQLWSLQDKVVHLTIAPENDSELSESDTLITNLQEAVEKVRDPARPVVIQPYTRRLFTLTARLDIDPAYLLADVENAARLHLETSFGYNSRDLAQPVSAAEVIAALHDVAGVVSADLDSLAVLLDGATMPTGEATPEAVLPVPSARGPGQSGAGQGFSPAELLTVLPSAIILTTREASDA